MHLLRKSFVVLKSFVMQVAGHVNFLVVYLWRSHCLLGQHDDVVVEDVPVALHICDQFSTFGVRF